MRATHKDFIFLLLKKNPKGILILFFRGEKIELRQNNYFELTSRDGKKIVGTFFMRGFRIFLMFRHLSKTNGYLLHVTSENIFNFFHTNKAEVNQLVKLN